jgi:uncharacterized protein DUF3180
MSAEPQPPDDGPEPSAQPGGRMQPMGPGGIAAWAVIGLVGGWLFHRLLDRGTGTPPTVSWVQPLALLLVAAILGGTAWSTRRTLQQGPRRLRPHQAVNRLVLARACAYVGALVAGFYLGYAVSWLGVETSDLAGQRVLRSACAGVAGLLIVAGGVFLERACRVPPADDEP